VESEIVFRELPPDDPKVRCPDISLAREVLDWKPEVGLEEGLELTLPYFQSEAARIREGARDA
jgi:nucleoside-diphosphate-sugar epimerase